MEAGINDGRVERLGRVMGRIGVNPILRLEESDPQYLAVLEVANRTSPGYASVTAVLTALVSYRLAMRGEEWWSCYARMITSNARVLDVDDAGRNVVRFIMECPGGVVRREAKVRRVRKALYRARQALIKLFKNPEAILESSSWLTNSLAKSLSTKPWKKTIVFSAKMAYYAGKTLNRNSPAPRDAPIPVDLRVSCMSTSSGLIDVEDYRVLLKNPLLVIRAWTGVSRISGVPQLNIDSVIWITGRAPMDYDVVEARSVVEERLRDYLGDHAGILARELVYRSCAKP